jgi:uncharacterized membrane protein YphA (DoxX/SURF4 family)
MYTSFLRGWPGVGVLLLRLALSCGLLANAVDGLADPSQSEVPVRFLETVTAALLVFGLWTPIAGVLVALIQLGTILTATAAFDPLLLRAAVGLSLTFLGPGAWSLDARLYGRRRVEIKSPHHN